MPRRMARWLRISTFAVLVVLSSLPLFRETLSTKPKNERAAVNVDQVPGETSSHGSDPAKSKETNAPGRLISLPATPGSKAETCRSEPVERRLQGGSLLLALGFAHVRSGSDGNVSTIEPSCSLPKQVVEHLAEPIRRHGPPRRA